MSGADFKPPLLPSETQEANVTLETSVSEGSNCNQKVAYRVEFSNCDRKLQCWIEKPGVRSKQYKLKPGESVEFNLILEAPPDIQSGYYEIDYRATRIKDGYATNAGFGMYVLEEQEEAAPRCESNYSISDLFARKTAPGIGTSTSIGITNKEGRHCKNAKTFQYKFDCPEKWECSSLYPGEYPNKIVIEKNESGDRTVNIRPPETAERGVYNITVEAGYGNNWKEKELRVKLGSGDELVGEMPTSNAVDLGDILQELIEIFNSLISQ